jgi:dolichol-phosphate mannosyltransferase
MRPAWDRVWVVIPAFDEAATIRPLAEAALALCPRVVVVDDGSRDGTAERVADLPLTLLRHDANRGKAASLRSAFTHALRHDAEAAITLDGDGQHDPADLPRLLAAARTGADVVLGSRYVEGGGVEGMPLHRRLLSRGGSAYARAVLGCPLRDLTGGFKCFRADALRAIDLDAIAATGFAFQVEATYRAVCAGLRVEEVPIVFHERRAGHSKLSAGIAAEALWRIPALR